MSKKIGMVFNSNKFNEIPYMSHKNFWNGETKKAVKGIHS